MHRRADRDRLLPLLRPPPLHPAGPGLVHRHAPQAHKKGTRTYTEHVINLASV